MSNQSCQECRSLKLKASKQAAVSGDSVAVWETELVTILLESVQTCECESIFTELQIYMLSLTLVFMTALPAAAQL